MSDPELVVVAEPAAGAIEAAGRVAAALTAAVEARGRADWATTGGSTPIAMYAHLSTPPFVDSIPWAKVHVWWGDDRFVPRDHPLSNVKGFDDIMLGIGEAEEGTGGGRRGVPIPVANLHPFPAGEAIAHGRGTAWCAETLADELRAARLPEVGGWPAFDLLHLGIGGDGHLLSVFPGSAAFDSDALALGIPAPTHIEPHVERVTLNPAVVGAASRVLVAAYGPDKADVVARIFGPERDPRRWPAQLALRPGATWILDETVAAGLPGH